MHPALMLVTAASLGWGSAAEFRRVEPVDLLAAAFVARLSARLGAEFSLSQATPDADALTLWYPRVPAADIPAVNGPSPANPRRDLRYDLRPPYFRSKP